MVVPSLLRMSDSVYPSTFSDGPQAQLGAVGKERQLVGAGEHPDHAGVGMEDLGERPAQIPFAGWRTKIRHASSLMSTSSPARLMASTPLRMCATRCRKKASSTKCAAAIGARCGGRVRAPGIDALAGRLPGANFGADMTRLGGDVRNCRACQRSDESDG